jgi:Transcriptional regulators
MTAKGRELDSAVRELLETLPPVWDHIRSNLRAAATGRFDISLDQFHTLRHIRKGYRTVRDLSEKRGVSRAAISQSVDILVKKGLVTRKQEGDDRRLVSLELTPYAAGVLDENYEANSLWMAERMSSLTTAELGELRRSMDTLRRVFAPETLEDGQSGR